ncbi:MAG TPA: DUF4032 domain-containing protein [Nitriliruptorales bacterium]
MTRRDGTNVFQLRVRTGHPDFLDLPWTSSVAEWSRDRVAEVTLGIHRHPVQVVDYDEGRYVVKELPRHYAQREWDNLRRLAEEKVPAVTIVGLVTGRTTDDDEALDAAVITRWLDWSIPYRMLFARVQPRALRDPMIDALVDLLVRAHLSGFLWGDCSLSNTLFRRDAGRLAAYVVDTETGSLHAELTDGQREWELDLAIEKCAGELFDLQAAGMLDPDVDPSELGDDLRARYEALWSELTHEEVLHPDERHRVHERLRRINDLGYDVDEVELVGDHGSAGLRLRISVPEPGRHSRLLFELAGVEAQDNQARELLSDIHAFGAWLEDREGRPLSDTVKAHRWHEQVFQPVLDAVPGAVRGRREPAEIFHGARRYWLRRCHDEGRDVDRLQAAADWAAEVLATDTGVLDLDAVRQAADDA